MCNLYAQTKSQDAMRQVFRDVLEDGEDLIDAAGNLAPASGIFPDYAAPIIRRSERRDWRLTTARWGMPTPPVYLTAKRTDLGVTNIRNVSSPHWRRWLGVEHRCLVPFTSFSELDARPGAPRNNPVWFALGQDRPLAFFAGICTDWTSVRKLKGSLPDGVAERLHFLEARGETDLLWTVEEALRARPVSLVIAAPEKPISLTAGRRLQLAAEAGETTGLMLIQEGRGCNAAETRWKCDPLPSPLDSTRHRWILNKNKKGTIGIYDVSWNGATAAVHLVPQAGERHQPEGPPR